MREGRRDGRQDYEVTTLDGSFRKSQVFLVEEVSGSQIDAKIEQENAADLEGFVLVLQNAGSTQIPLRTDR